MAKKQAKAEKESVFYVGVQNPADVRKTMLEASKELLLSLKQYEHLRTIRAQKAELYAAYTSQITGIKSLLLKLQRAVPKHDMSVMQPPAPKPVVVEPIAAKQAPVRATKVSTDKLTAMDEVTRLEAELAEIERKLGNA